MRYVIGLSFAALAVWVLQATGILMALMVFLMIGTIPGTHISVPPTYMLVLLTTATIAIIAWIFRQRPVQQIQDMKEAYHQQLDATPRAIPKTAQRAPSMVASGFKKSFAQTRLSTQRAKRRTTANARRSVSAHASRLEVASRPVRMMALATGAIIIIASTELSRWSRPHIQRIAAWLHKQASYSLKGTMLSAHRWSSLSKKLLSSLTSLLKRCNSVLKRGKSLLIRSAR